MPSATKVERVRSLAERFKAAGAAVFTDYRGLTVQEAAELRAALAEVDARFSVIKNSLARLAMKEAGLEALEELIEGPTAVAFVAGDPVAAAKRLLDAAKRMPVLDIRGGYAEGRVLSAEELKALAALESREAMLARVAGMAKSQLSRAVWMQKALQSRFLSLLEAYREKVPSAEEAPPSAEEPSAEEAPPPAEEPAPAEEANPETAQAEQGEGG